MVFYLMTITGLLNEKLLNEYNYLVDPDRAYETLAWGWLQVVTVRACSCLM